MLPNKVGYQNDVIFPFALKKSVCIRNIRSSKQRAWWCWRLFTWPHTNSTRVVFTGAPSSNTVVPFQRAVSVSQGLNCSEWLDFLDFRNHLFPVFSLCTLTDFCCHSFTSLFWSCCSLGGWLWSCRRNNFKLTGPIWAVLRQRSHPELKMRKVIITGLHLDCIHTCLNMPFRWFTIKKNKSSVIQLNIKHCSNKSNTVILHWISLQF